MSEKSEQTKTENVINIEENILIKRKKRRKKALKDATIFCSLLYLLVVIMQFIIFPDGARENVLLTFLVPLLLCIVAFVITYFIFSWCNIEKKQNN